MERVRAALVRNPFDPLGSREIRELAPGVTVGEAVRELAPTEDADYTAAVNGQVIDLEQWADTPLAAGDSLSFAATPRGGGGGGKDPLRTVAMLAVVVAAPMAAAALVPATIAGSAALAGAVETALSVGFTAGGMALVNNAMPAQQGGFDQTTPSRDNFESSKTYGWRTGANSIEVGGALPVLIGRHRVVPPLISRYVETRGDKQYINMLFAVAGHELDAIHSIRLEGEPLSNLEEVSVETRLGGIDQAPVPYFDAIRHDVAQQSKLSTDWLTRTTSGDVDRLGIALQAPQGLWYARDDGGLGQISVDIVAEYRAVGDTEWRDWLGHTHYIGTDDFHHRSSNNSFVAGWAATTSIWSPFRGGEDRAINIGHNPAHVIRPGASIRSYVNGSFHAEHVVKATRTRSFEREAGKRCHEDARSHHLHCHTVYDTVYYSEIIVEDYGLPSGMDDYTYSNPVALKGRQNSAKRWFFELPGPYAGYGQYEYRIKLASSPPSGSRYGSDLYLEYHQEVIDEALSYPGTSLLGVRALATEKLSGSQPRVSCIGEHMSEVIDGVPRPLDNPAWACAWMLIDDLNGGSEPPERLDLARFEQWAKDCYDFDITCNIYFDDIVNLKKALDTIGTVGRGQVIQMGSDFTCVTDFPAESAQRFAFGMGNIAKDSFSEEWLPGNERANVIEVTYWDEEQDFERQVFSLQQDGADQLETELVKQSVTLYGCTRRRQAAKHARFLLNRNRYLTLTASWSADADALACLPGDVVDVAHDIPQWGHSGRVLEADEWSVRLDREVTLEPDVTYVLDVKLSDDTRATREVTVGSQTVTDLIEVDDPYDTVPQRFDIYSFGEIGTQYKQFRILSITKDSELRRRIEALEYYPEVYNDSTTVPELTPSELAQIEGFQAAERWVYGSDGSGRSVIDLSWRGSDLRWNIWLRQPDADWELLDDTHKQSYRIDIPLAKGATYGVAVSYAEPERGEIAQVTIRGDEARPQDVEGFIASQRGGQIRLKWDHVPEYNRHGYEIRQGETWAQGEVVADDVQENKATYEASRKGLHRFWVKAFNNSRIYSAGAAMVEIDVAYFKELNVVLDKQEIPDSVSAASLAHNFTLAEDGLLYWTPSLTDQLVSQMTDQSAEIKNYDGDEEPGEYITQEYDLQALVYSTLRLSREFDTSLLSATDQTYPERTDQDYPQDTDQDITSKSRLLSWWRKRDTEGNWTSWKRFTEPEEVYARYIQARFTTELDTKDQTFSVSQMSTSADVPDKTSDLENVEIPSGGKVFDLSADFDLTILVKYVVSASPLGLSPKYPAVDKSVSGGDFELQLFDQNGDPVSGYVDISVRGY